MLLRIEDFKLMPEDVPARQSNTAEGLFTASLAASQAMLRNDNSML